MGPRICSSRTASSKLETAGTKAGGGDSRSDAVRLVADLKDREIDLSLAGSSPPAEEGPLIDTSVSELTVSAGRGFARLRGFEGKACLGGIPPTDLPALPVEAGIAPLASFEEGRAEDFSAPPSFFFAARARSLPCATRALGTQVRAPRTCMSGRPMLEQSGHLGLLDSQSRAM